MNQSMKSSAYWQEVIEKNQKHLAILRQAVADLNAVSPRSDMEESIMFIIKGAENLLEIYEANKGRALLAEAGEQNGSIEDKPSPENNPVPSEESPLDKNIHLPRDLRKPS